MTYNNEDILDSTHDCEGICDYRKNLRCCREVFDMLEWKNTVEARLKALEDKINKD